MGLVLDAARAREDGRAGDRLRRHGPPLYGADADYGGFEPDDADFLSPSLVEIDLLRRVHPAEEFVVWLEGFLPNLDGPRWRTLRQPVPIDDPAGPLGSHLIGLALSRAWCWRNLATALPDRHRWRGLAATAASAHAQRGIPSCWDTATPLNTG